MTEALKTIGEEENEADSAANDETESTAQIGSLDKTAIHTVADALDLSDVAVNTAEAIYREAIKAGVHEGRRLERLQVASVPLAARVHAKPVALGRVAEVADEHVEGAHIERRHELSHIVKTVAAATETALPPTSAEEFVAGIVEGVEADAEADEGASTFSASGTIITEARAHLASANGPRVGSGNSPPGIAAGAVFRVAEDRGESVTIGQVGDAAGVSEPTVRKYARSFT